MTALARTLYRGLADGYGVEDISARSGIPMADLRETVTRWRRADMLKFIYGAHPAPLEIRGRIAPSEARSGRLPDSPAGDEPAGAFS